MNIIEIILLVIAVLGVLLGYQAHRNGLSISAQANADVATAKADAEDAVHALELRIVSLETKIGITGVTITTVKPPAAATAGPAAAAGS